ncbi:MAG: ABC transporter substrate-binding protein [Ignavibacteria bacterium]
MITINTAGYSQVRIGIALPLMTNSSGQSEKLLGEQMLKGIKDALEEYKSSEPDIDVSIKIEDTKKDQTATLDAFNKLASDSNLIAILGPVFSSELVNNAGAAAFHKIPIITPTATLNFLAQNNEYVFQLNPTYDIRGRLMAKFAINELGIKNFVILSEDSYGKNFADSFSDEVRRNKGNILLTEYYNKDAFNIIDQLKNIKSKIIENDKFIDFSNLNSIQIDKLKKSNIKFSYVDSLINERLVVSIYKLFGKTAESELLSLSINPSVTFDKNKTIIPGKVDAIYIPVSNFNEIPGIVSQFFSENIVLTVLGTSDWNNEKILQENHMYIKELYFESDFYLDGSKKNFIEKNEAEIKNYYFGYDGMKLILDKIIEGNNTRASLYEALENTNNYKTVHNNVSMNERTNRHMSIMHFKNGALIKKSDYEY